MFENAASLESYWGDAIHSLKGRRNVIDIRTIGIMAAVELAPRQGAPAERAYDAMLEGYEKGIMLRVTADTIAMSPPLVLTKAHIDEIVDKLGQVLDAVE